MAKRLHDGFNVWHTPGVRLTDQGLAARRVAFNSNAIYETEHHGDVAGYHRWLAVMGCVRSGRMRE